MDGDGPAVVAPDGCEVDVYPIPGDLATNIAFGAGDLRRAVVTLSRSGRVIETTWPRPGLALNVGQR
jgi:sugar lactone lactonase YvrE